MFNLRNSESVKWSTQVFLLFFSLAHRRENQNLKRDFVIPGGLEDDGDYLFFV